MADLFDAMRRSFEASQALQSMEGSGAARKKYREEQREIDDEMARLREQGIQTQAEIAKAERGAKKTSNRRFWQSLVTSTGLEALVGKALEYALVAGTAGTAAPLLSAVKAKKAYDLFKKTKKLRKGAKLLYSATKGSKAGKKELARDLEKVPEEFRFIEEEGADFLTQERKRGRETAAGYQRGARTMKDIKESAYEGVGGVDAFSAMGLTQMMAGAQALSYADLAATAGKEVASLFGEKSVVGEQAMRNMVSLPTDTSSASPHLTSYVEPSLSSFKPTSWPYDQTGQPLNLQSPSTLLDWYKKSDPLSSLDWTNKETQLGQKNALKNFDLTRTRFPSGG